MMHDAQGNSLSKADNWLVYLVQLTLQLVTVACCAARDTAGYS